METQAQERKGTLTLRDAVNELEMQYDGIANQFAMALPPHIKVEKFKGVVITAANLNPDLLRADRRSLFNECLKAANDGLLPDGREGFLNVYAGKVKWEPMIAGIIKRIRQSGEISSVGARCVYEEEMKHGPVDPATGKPTPPRFQFIIDEQGERIEHKPILFGDRGAVVGCYAYVAFKDGTRDFEPLSFKDIEKIRQKSRSPNKGPWVDWWEEMAKKSAIRRLSKRLPLSSEIMAAINREDVATEIDELRRQQMNRAVAQISGPEIGEEPPVEEQEAETLAQGISRDTLTLEGVEQTVERAKPYLKTPGLTKGDLHDFSDHIKSIIANAAIPPEDKKRLTGDFNAAYLTQLKTLS